MIVIRQPHYIDLEEARQVLAQMGVQLTLRQIQRAAEQDGQGRRKMPFFVDPIEGKLKIEKNDLMSVYFRKQVEAHTNYGDRTCILVCRYCIILVMAEIRKRSGSKGITYQVRYLGEDPAGADRTRHR